MGIYKRGKVYWIDYYDPNRKRVQESSQSSRRRDAENLLSLRKSEILRGDLQTPVKITFGEFGERYMEHAKANKRSWLRDEQMLGHLRSFSERKGTGGNNSAGNRGLQNSAAKQSFRLNGEPGTGFAQAYVQSRNHWDLFLD